MADTGPADIGELNENQQTALATYIAVTDQDHSAAIPLLQRSQWNVQIAIAKFFDGEAPDPIQEALTAQADPPPPVRQSPRRETLLNSGVSSRSISASSREAAPRIVPQSESRSVLRPPLIFSLLLTPVTLVLRFISTSLGIFGYLFPFLPRLLSRFRNGGPSRSISRNTTGRRPLNPTDTAARFIREFGEEHGDHALKFFENGYAQAYDAAKKDLKYLLIILLSPEHDDTSAFVRETLLSSDFQSFVNNPENKIILWAGNVQDSEAFQVATALNCTKFPFAAMTVQTTQDSPLMTVIARVSGLLPPTTLISRLRTAIAQNSAALDRARATRAEQDATRNLRQEQNSAYERSLAQDRERARLRREAEATQARLERETKAKVEASANAARNLAQWKQWKALKIAPEPSLDIKDAIRLSIRLPSGNRVVRRFPPQGTMDDLYAYVECYDVLETELPSSQVQPPSGYNHEYKFTLVSPMPRMVYDLASGGTIADRIGRGGNLIVELMAEDGDEADE